MRKESLSSIVAVILIGATLSEQQPWRGQTGRTSATSRMFPSTRTFLLASTAVVSPYFRNEDFFILEDDDKDSHKTSPSSRQLEQGSLRRESLENKSRQVCSAIASGVRGILAGDMTHTNRHDALLPTLVAAAFFVSTVLVKSAVVRLTRASSRQDAPSLEVNNVILDESDSVLPSSSDEDLPCAIQEPSLMKPKTNSHLLVEQESNEMGLVTEIRNDEPEQPESAADVVVSKVEYDNLVEEAGNLKTELQQAETRLKELQQIVKQFEHLQQQHDIKLHDSIAKERKQAQELIRSMQRVMVSVMKKERDDLVTDFQRHASFLKEMLLSEVS